MILVTFVPSICLVYSYIRIFFAAMKHRQLSAEHTIQLRFNQDNRATKRVQSRRSRDSSSTVKILDVVRAFSLSCRSWYFPSLQRLFINCTDLTLSNLIEFGNKFRCLSILKKRTFATNWTGTLQNAKSLLRENFVLRELSSRATKESRAFSWKTYHCNLLTFLRLLQTRWTVHKLNNRDTQRQVSVDICSDIMQLVFSERK